MYFSSPGRNPGRAIVLPLASVEASVLAKCKSFYVKVFYVMGKLRRCQVSYPVPMTGLVKCGPNCFV